MPPAIRAKVLSMFLPFFVVAVGGCEKPAANSAPPAASSRSDSAASRPIAVDTTDTARPPVKAPAPPAKPAVPDLVRERARHPTVLTRRGPAPQRYSAEQPPAGVQEVTYTSGKLTLKAWLAKPAGNKPHPAVVFCHGGFAFGADDWEQAEPFLDAGFVLMTPTLRGENGNPGDFELWLGEIDDAIAAGRYLADLPGVDSRRVFIAGHSSGATTAMLAVVQPNPFAAAAAYGPVTDCLWLIRLPEFKGLAPFDPADTQESYLRSPKYFITALQCPLFVFVGDNDTYSLSDTLRLDSAAGAAGKKCVRTIVPGDHHSAVPVSIQQTIQAFNKIARDRAAAP